MGTAVKPVYYKDGRLHVTIGGHLSVLLVLVVWLVVVPLLGMAAIYAIAGGLRLP